MVFWLAGWLRSLALGGPLRFLCFGFGKCWMIIGAYLIVQGKHVFQAMGKTTLKLAEDFLERLETTNHFFLVCRKRCCAQRKALARLRKDPDMIRIKMILYQKNHPCHLRLHLSHNFIPREGAVEPCLQLFSQKQQPSPWAWILWIPNPPLVWEPQVSVVPLRTEDILKAVGHNKAINEAVLSTWVWGSKTSLGHLAIARIRSLRQASPNCVFS